MDELTRERFGPLPIRRPARDPREVVAERRRILCGTSDINVHDLTEERYLAVHILGKPAVDKGIHRPVSGLPRTDSPADAGPKPATPAADVRGPGRTVAA